MTPANDKIIVVDDSDSGRYIKARILRHAGFTVHEAANGHEALNLVEADRPHLVLLDVKLPDMNGIDLCRQIKSSDPWTLVLQTSAAFTGINDRAAGLAGGADSYLVEPIDPQELLATVEALLRLRRAELELRRTNETLEQKVAERTEDLAETNRQLAEEIRRRALVEESLRHAQKLDALGQITGGIAHDFNNLLTVVLGCFSRLERGLQKGQPISAKEFQRFVEAGKKAAQDCEYLTRQLLAFARKDTLRLESVNINEKITGFVDLLTRALGENVVLDLSLAPTVWTTQIDPGQLEAAILNLALNARDAMPSGGSLHISTNNVAIGAGDDKLHGSFFPGPPPPDNYVVFSVSDRGVGMNPDVLSRAFEPFFTTKDVGKGSGLGLSQVYGFATQSGGVVAVDTNPNQGTRITIFLPRSTDRATRTNTPVREGTIPGGEETILVVEDNHLVLEFAVQTLTDLGYRVLEAGDGASALKLLDREGSIDLLFTDMVMPNNMSGIELARAARRRRPDLKVLITSGYSGDAMTQKKEADFSFISKPYSPEILARRLREIIETEPV